MDNKRKKKYPEKGIRERTFEFSLVIIKIIQFLPKNTIGFELGKQILRAGTSVGANVEEAAGARTKKEFTSCMNIAKREARETEYWLRLIAKSRLVSKSKVQPLLDEIMIILRILTAIVKTSQKNN
ncbi:MAG: four helix bundle protein [Nitrospirae bacterium]|nr:four helix bundle protein [Nitrospirota bacterium]